MRRSLRPSMLLAILVALPASSLAQPQNQFLDARRVFVDSLIISGTQTVDSAELAEITGALDGSEFDDDPEELQELTNFKITAIFKSKCKSSKSK